MDIQSLFNVVGEACRDERKQYHLKLGELIEVLKDVDPSMLVKTSDGESLGGAFSYRGYYSDLSFEPGGEKNAGDLLSEARGALNKTMEGYKGGDFIMGNDAPLWLAHYGESSGVAIVGAKVMPDHVLLITKRVD